MKQLTRICWVFLLFFSPFSFSVDWNSFDSVHDYLSNEGQLKKLTLSLETQSSPRKITYAFQTSLAGMNSCANSEAIVFSYINNHSELLGLFTPGTLFLKSSKALNTTGTEELREKLVYVFTINGIELADSSITVLINGNCEITFVSAVIFTPSGFLVDKASNGEFITKWDAINSVQSDGTVKFLTSKPYEANLRLIKDPPYVVWEVLGPNEYRVDAENEAIISRRSRLQE